MEQVSFLSLVPHLKALALNLEYRATSVSHGSHSGFRKGFEDQLVEYRNYVPGDDLRFLDWKLYARTEKYYIREGYQRSRQKVLIWLDTSLSQRFTPEKFNTAWLLALSLAYLYRQQNDEVYLYFEHESSRGGEVTSITHPSDFVQFNDFFMSSDKNLKRARKTTDVEHSIHAITPYLKATHKLIWLNDLYVPIEEYQRVLSHSSQNRWNLSLMHLAQEREWDNRAFRKTMLSKLVDIETGEWLPSAALRNYPEIWEKAVNKRVRMLVARGFMYLRGRVEDGPLKILGSIRSL